MAVEKLSESSKSQIEQNPYAQISNLVIEHIKDNDAFRVYSFLYSKSRDWKVIKKYTNNVCGLGEKKSKQVWSYLSRCGLIEKIEIRDSKGRIIEHDLLVLNGTKFNKDEPFLNTESTGSKIAPMDVIHRGKNPPGGESTRVEKKVLLNKDITNKENKLKIDKSFIGDSQESHSKTYRDNFNRHFAGNEPPTLFDERIDQKSNLDMAQLVDFNEFDTASKENYRQNNDQFLGKNTENKQISDKNPINFELNLAKEPTTTIIPKPKAKKVKKRTKVPLDYLPKENHVIFCEDSGLDIKVQLNKFIAKHKSSGWYSEDWDAEFDYFLLNGKEFQQRFLQSPPKKNTVVGYLKGLNMKPSSNNRSLEHGITIG